MKKIITLVITIAMVFTMTVPAFADEVATSQPKPNKVQNLTVNKYNYNTLRLTWTADTEATAYDIYRSQTKKSFKKVGTATEPTYKDSDLTSGKIYYYKVRATNDLGKGSYSDMAYNKPQPGTAKITSVKYDNSGKNKSEIQVLLKVSWNKVKGADKYQVYRTIKGKNKFKRIATVSKLSYTDNFTDIASSYDQAASKEYQYKVRAYKVVGKNKVYGYKSKIVGYTPDWTVDEIKEYLIKEGESVVLYEYDSLKEPIMGEDGDLTYLKKTEKTYTMKHSDAPSTTPEASTWSTLWPRSLGNIYQTGVYIKEDLGGSVKSDIASYGEASPSGYDCFGEWWSGSDEFVIYTRVEDGDMMIYCLF